MSNTVTAYHHENLPMQYTEIFFQKQKLKISLEIYDIFSSFAQSIDCGYTLEPPRRGVHMSRTCYPDARPQQLSENLELLIVLKIKRSICCSRLFHCFTCMTLLLWSPIFRTFLSCPILVIQNGILFSTQEARLNARALE